LKNGALFFKIFFIIYILSVGPNCIRATDLQNNNYRFHSYPFDWMFTSLDMIEHCIEDEFKILLDKNYLE
jgi:hypothetical protein